MSKAKKKPAPKPKPKPAPSTALAVRQQPAALVPKASSLPAVEITSREAVGIYELKLSDKEESVLAKAVDPLDILIKPNGVAYLSHPSYTRWFNAAFGRLGWSIVPIGAAAYNGRTVVLEHILYIHGTPVAKAWGEQEYFEKNKDQSYGDAIEACTASALRRCAKRLGIGLEMWDKAYLTTWQAEHCVRVTVNDRGESKAQWRRKQDPPLRGEIHAGGRGGGKQQRQQEQAAEFHGSDAAIDAEYATAGEDEPRDAAHGAENEPITTQQAERLYKVATKVKRAPTEIKMWLKVVFGYNSSKEIKRREYNTILRTIEAPGPLPMREPGQEG